MKSVYDLGVRVVARAGCVLNSVCHRHAWDCSFLGDDFLDFNSEKEFVSVMPLGQNKVKKVDLHIIYYVMCEKSLF